MSSSSKRPENVLQKNYNVPVNTTDTSIFDETLSTLKERFEAEMRRYDEEMNNFSSKLTRFYAQMIPTGIALTQSNAPTSQTATNVPQTDKPVQRLKQGPQSLRLTPQTERPASQNEGPTSPLGLITGWQALISSPLVVGEGSSKSLKLQFDVSQFSPEEVTVQVQDNVLMVSARHEENSDHTTVLREYNKEFLLPKGIDFKNLESSLSRDGVLTIEAPLPLLPVVDSENE
ncbi:unnamed protein product [Chilo suppressalis]|uniref:SHSP domain-containing protein n=1 Tax=Chilo suppressalis TaxID=168631 RepID=A0ABN8B1Z8_CHISP|nr:unnamed protein product [Chilo suppressalis]